MLDSCTPNRESGLPGPVGGRLAVRPVEDLSTWARAVGPREQGVGNGRLGRARPPTSCPASRLDHACRPASPDTGGRRCALPRVGLRAANPSLPRSSGEQGAHTDPQTLRNGYIYCAATSHIVSSVTNPQLVAGSEEERGSMRRLAPTDPTLCRGLRSDARAGTHATCQNRAASSTRAHHRRLTPSPHRQAICGGAGRRATPSTGAAPASTMEPRHPGWGGPSRETTPGECPARMRMTAQTGSATERSRARVRPAPMHRGEVQFDDRTATDGLHNGVTPWGSR